MNVLFLMLNYPFDKKRDHMYKDLSRKFAEKGHNVIVVALLEEKYGKETFVEEDGNHTILWIKAGNYFGVNKIRKGITALLLPFYFNENINKFLKGISFDLVLYPTPAITLYSTVKRIKKKFPKAKYLLVVKDIFPQNALDIGMLRKNIIYYYFRNIEKKLYNISDYLGCMSKRNVEYLLENNDIEKKKFFILENWSSNYGKTELINGEKEKLLDKYSLKNKFILIFGGNIGPANELEFLIELAKRVRENKVEDVVFLIIGKGTKKSFIEKLVLEYKLENVKIFDFIPTEEYDKLVSLSDVGLINLNKKYTIPNIPSKTLNLMRAGKPILAVTDINTDYNKLIVDDAKCGLWSSAGDLEKYFKNFMELKDNIQLREEMGINARKYFERYLTTDVAYNKIMEKVGDEY